MKDSSVRPVGLFDTRRQRRLLDGLTQRFRNCVGQQQVLHEQDHLEQAEEDIQLTKQRETVTVECRSKRRAMLTQWDQAEEALTSQYEITAIRNQKELNRLAALYRRKTAEETEVIKRKVESRRQAVLQQYENRRKQPGQLQKKEVNMIDESLLDMIDNLELARELTVRRLDRLPEVPAAENPEDDMREPDPESVQQTLDNIGLLTRKCGKAVVEMQTGAASKIVDSFYLPGGVAVFILVWAAIAFIVAPKPPWLWMALGIIPAGIIGFSIYMILLWPLKRMTRRLYPMIERLGLAADECAVAGRKISADTARETSSELLQVRDAHLAAARRWKKEQLAEMEKLLVAEQETMREKLTLSLQESDKNYSNSFHRVGEEMRAKADGVAHGINQHLADTDRSSQQQREQSSQSRQARLQRLALRLKDGVSRGLSRIAESDQQCQERFPDWNEVLAETEVQTQNIDFLPLGWVKIDESLKSKLRDSPTLEIPAAAQVVTAQVGAADQTAADADQVDRIAGSDLFRETEIPQRMPIALHRRIHSGVVIHAANNHLDQAIDLAQQILWRLLTGAPPSRAKLTLIDPLGRGQHFTSFMALTDHDPSLVGHRVWTTDNKIDERLGELAHHVEDVLQASLRDRFERIEDYNEVAGSMAEPYRAVAAVGFPEGLSRNGIRHLRALIESGLRCGIFTVLVCDQSKPWPADMPIPDGDKLLQLKISEEGDWTLMSEGLEELPFEPAPSPPAAIRGELVEKIGQAAVTAGRVEIPLEKILPANLAGKGSTADGIDIVVGSQGANRTLSLSLGEGVQQHVLIAGKTGSGKSTLLHSIITSGAHHYRADELHFYLLDFKKGVEFKPYAEFGLPHARVIGIESEREFGRSVLQRLDEELQQRGEKFRAAGVQELSEYRSANGEMMPRIMLVIDEFQELFVRDDRIAGDCALLLDRLVRQGRSFGMHVILSSQSLAGAYSLPRATLGQMAVRIAMQCSESDAALILADDNTAARLISRPGEAIYNDAGGLVEGNQPFQVAWLSSAEHQEMLRSLADRDAQFNDSLPPVVVFEGNRPCRWTPQLADAAIGQGAGIQGAGLQGAGLQGVLGESVEIGPPLSLTLARDTGRNVLLMTPVESRGAILASTLSGIAKSNPKLEVFYFDGSRVDDAPSLAPWLEASGIQTKIVKTRDCDTEIFRVKELVKERGDEATDVAPIVLVIDPLERFRDLRQDDSFNFSLDSAGAEANSGAALQNILRDGPPANVFVFLVCGSAETLSRWLPRASQHDLELRILGQMNQSDSSLLIDSPMASDLSAATMLLYDDADGRTTKFRQCDLPEPQHVKDWLS